MTLDAGTRLGPYEIAAPLGAGGMGEVYRARDTRLDRTVAIKILPSDLARSATLRQRFEREARAISALDHPHICVLHDVGRQDGIDFLVMEYLEGESLDERLRKGALPLPQALRYGIEIAQALDCAHRKGIVHRDLKPANVMITKSGTKLLDFGIAKLRAARPPSASPPGGPPTGDRPLTRQGTLLGTFRYMSPEQLEGREPDVRSDIFAFGSVLYEMVTGQRCFNGTSQASLIAAVLTAEPPPISRLQPLVPTALDRVVAKCLAKDPDDRWQSAGDLASQLEWLAASSASAAVPAPATRARRGQRVAWAVAVAALGIAALAFALRGREQLATPQAVTASLLPPPGIDYGFDVDQGPPALSPDGRRLAFIGVFLAWASPHHRRFGRERAYGVRRRLSARRDLGAGRRHPLRGDASANPARRGHRRHTRGRHQARQRGQPPLSTVPSGRTLPLPRVCVRWGCDERLRGAPGIDRLAAAPEGRRRRPVRAPRVDPPLAREGAARAAAEPGDACPGGRADPPRGARPGARDHLGEHRRLRIRHSRPRLPGGARRARSAHLVRSWRAPSRGTRLSRRLAEAQPLARRPAAARRHLGSGAGPILPRHLDLRYRPLRADTVHFRAQQRPVGDLVARRPPDRLFLGPRGQS
ncbi:MAG: hypothetical protein DMF78_18865 [Acidobacteria bacterium]|nr:MAG: hypothetical protein DMF78_18865 [Acidobacteriota bacterium]